MSNQTIVQVVITRERSGYKLTLFSPTETIEVRSFYSLGKLLEYVGTIEIKHP